MHFKDTLFHTDFSSLFFIKQRLSVKSDIEMFFEKKRLLMGSLSESLITEFTASRHILWLAILIMLHNEEETAAQLNVKHGSSCTERHNLFRTFSFTIISLSYSCSIQDLQAFILCSGCIWYSCKQTVENIPLKCADNILSENKSMRPEAIFQSPLILTGPPKFKKFQLWCFWIKLVWRRLVNYQII